MKYFYTSIL